MVLYNIKNKKIVWNRGRCRGLKDSQERIGGILTDIKKLLKIKKKIKILEIGCGYGKALLELRKLFGDKVEIHGINLEKRWDTKLSKKFGISEKIFTSKDIEENLPKIHILDAGKKMPFKDKSFDYIYSWASVQYVLDKAKFLEETNRMLTEKGIARIEMQEVKKETYAAEYRNLFEIQKNNRIINFKTYIKKFKNIKTKQSKFQPWSYIIMKKAKKLDLKLKRIKTIDLHAINLKWWGNKVVYLVR